MSQKRYCDSCDELIKENSMYYEVVLNIKNNNDIISSWKGDHCYECAKSGEGLIKIMEAYENSTN